MRVLLKLLVVLGVIVTGVWIGGEMLLARKAAALIADDPQLEAAAVRELRQPQRLGIRVEQLELAATQGSASLPWLDLWLPPQRPNEVHVTLPPTARVTLDGQTVTLTADAAGFSARFAPASGLALSAARLGAGDVTLDGQPVADRVTVTARLVGFGSDAPRAAGAAYDVTADIGGLSLAALTGGAMTGLASVNGGGRLWLDRAPARGGSASPPRLVGLRADGLELRLDDLTARLWGRVVAGAEGRAEGELLIDTADAEGFIARAADLGMLPQSTVPLATALLGGLAGGTADVAAPDEGEAETRVASRMAAEAAARVSRHSGTALPPLRTGELRIPIGFRDGKAWLGPLPVGPAPRFP